MKQMFRNKGIFKMILCLILVFSMVIPNVSMVSMADEGGQPTDQKEIIDWAKAKKESIEKAYGDMPKTEDLWKIAALGRLNKDIKDADKDVIYKSIISDGKLSTNAGALAKAILAARAAKIDPEKYYGHNLVDALMKAGQPNDIWTLSPYLQALTSDDYANTSDAIAKAKAAILKMQNAAGLWDFWGWQDATGFALYALAPFYNEPEVKAAFEKAVDAIGEKQEADGDVADNSNSLVMVAGALWSANSDYLTDARLVKGGKTMLHALKKYDIEGTSDFKWKQNQGANALATEQAFRSLVAYFVDGTVFDYRSLDKSAAYTEEEEKQNARHALQAQIERAENIIKKESSYDKKEIAALKTKLEEAKNTLSQDKDNVAKLKKATDELKDQVDKTEKTYIQPPITNEMTVTFTLKGMEKNGTTEEIWIAKKSYNMAIGCKVYDVFDKALKENNIEYYNKGNYVSKIKSPKTNQWLEEKDNGPNSGWMYTVNGKHPQLGLEEYRLSAGDDVVWHYTNDYTKEHDHMAMAGGVPNDNGVTTVKADVVVSGKTATVTVNETKAAEMLKQAKEKMSNEIVIDANVATAKADMVKVELAKKLAEDILKDTKADVTIKLPHAEFKLEKAALKGIVVQAKGDKLIIEITKADPTDAQKGFLGQSADVFELNVKSGYTAIHNFGDGKITVRKLIPDNLKEKKIVAVYIPEVQVPENKPFEAINGKRAVIDKKEYYEFVTSHFSRFALVDAEEVKIEEQNMIGPDEAKNLVESMKLNVKTRALKKSIRITVKADKAILKSLKDSGYTFKYKFFRGTKKNGKFKLIATKNTGKYTNTKVKKGKAYYYKARLMVYDKEGNLVAKTDLKQCKATKGLVKKTA